MRATRDGVAGTEGVATAMGEPLVRCTGLAKRYGRATALAGLDLTLRAGPPIALVGPNGAGKTTLLSLLAGFVRPSGGRVEVLGRRPGGAALAGRLAALPQDAALDPRLAIDHQLRVLAELQGLGRRAARAEAARALDAVGLGDAARRPPAALSHGMRKRVALAQTLLGEPTLVLLDEPTAGIDPENTRAIRGLIARRSTRTTFVVSSHNLDELERLCGSVVQLEGGRLVRHEALGGDVGAPSASSADAVASVAGAPGDGATNPPSDAAATLTLRLVDVPEEAFAEAARALGGVHALARLPQGEWRLTVDEPNAAAAALLGLLAERGWRWRQIGNGRSLEERLYGA